MAVSIYTVFSVLALPPVNLAVLALLLLVLVRRPVGRVLAGLCLVLLVLLSLPVVATALIASLAVTPTAPALANGVQVTSAGPGAIVVLGGDVHRSPDSPGASIGPLSLERVRAGAALQRRTGLPVLITGGIVADLPVPVGVLMATSITDDFGVPVRWTEPASLTTWENARDSAPLLMAAGITRVLLVTHAWHMRRSVLAFRRFGIAADPAPVQRDPAPELRLQTVMPSAGAWAASFNAIHEWAGLAFYSLRS